jgi:hypothetical protein
VQPNQTTHFFAAVPSSQAQVTFSSSWSGSDIAMSLVMPSGRVIDRTTTAADVTHDLSPTFESYAITNPEAGDWEVRLFGLDVPPAGEDAIVNFVSIPKPPETPTPAVTRVPRTKTPRPATHTSVPTVAPATSTPIPPTTTVELQPTATQVREVLGVVRPPNTGSGPQSGYGDRVVMTLAFELMMGVLCATVGIALARRARRQRS